jgi:hypothetical protein
VIQGCCITLLSSNNSKQQQTIQTKMPSSTTSNSKSEALARARAWRDQRCATSPTYAKKHCTNESPRRASTKSPPPPAKESLSSTTVETSTPKQEAKDRALTRAREFAVRLKEKKEQPKEDNMDIDNDIDNDIPAVIDIENENLSTASATVPTVHGKEISSAEMEEMKRIAAELKKLSERLEAVTNKNGGCN